MAAAFLTRVPIRVEVDWPSDLARSVPWFPVVGAAVGAAAGSTRWLAGLVMPSFAAAVVAVGISVLLTGAFHEDGLADTFDGLGGGGSRSQALEIMKDSRLGTFGMVALVLALALKIGLYEALDGPGAVLVAASAGGFSRAVAAGWMKRLPAATSGLGADYLNMVSSRSAAWAVVVGLALGAAVGPWGLAGMGAGVLASIVIARWASRKIGGLTGDVLGAVQVVSELGFLVAIVAVGAVGW